MVNLKVKVKRIPTNDEINHHFYSFKSCIPNDLQFNGNREEIRKEMKDYMKKHIIIEDIIEKPDELLKRKICERCKKEKFENHFIKNTDICRSCKSIEIKKNHKNKYKYDSFTKFNGYIHGAKQRGLLFRLSFDDFKRFITQQCFYCNNEPTPFNGIDRIDNSKGYIKNNCVSCCIKCNKMKNTLSKKDFLDQCKKIVEQNDK